MLYLNRIKSGLKSFKKLEFSSLERSVNKVRQEFFDIGILTAKIDAVDVFMLMGVKGAVHALVKDKVLTLSTLGYFNGEINVPEYTFRTSSTCDVLRHEYGHAYAGLHPTPFATTSFRTAFGGKYEIGRKTEMQSPEYCVSDYAEKDIAEDFAETFMLFIKYKGKLPKKFAKNEFIRVKWKAVEQVIETLKGYI